MRVLGSVLMKAGSPSHKGKEETTENNLLVAERSIAAPGSDMVAAEATIVHSCRNATTDAGVVAQQPLGGDGYAAPFSPARNVLMQRDF